MDLKMFGLDGLAPNSKIVSELTSLLTATMPLLENLLNEILRDKSICAKVSDTAKACMDTSDPLFAALPSDATMKLVAGAVAVRSFLKLTGRIE